MFCMLISICAVIFCAIQSLYGALMACLFLAIAGSASIILEYEWVTGTNFFKQLKLQLKKYHYRK